MRQRPNSERLADTAISVMVRLHALGANPMMRYVLMGSTRSPTRQFFDQGELRLKALLTGSVANHLRSQRTAMSKC